MEAFHSKLKIHEVLMPRIHKLYLVVNMWLHSLDL